MADTLPADGALRAALEGRPLGRWLHHEQSVNDRVVNPLTHHPLKEHPTRAPGDAYAPGAAWEQQVMFVPVREARAYGNPASVLDERSGISTPRGRVPILVHPRSHRVHAAAIRAHGLHPTGVTVTPTASFRSVLAVGAGYEPLLFKLSLDAVLGERRRILREPQIVRALLVSTLFDTIPESDRRALGLEWFPERAGAVETRTGYGYLVRELSPSLRATNALGTFVPMFSLASERPGARPLLVERIEASGERPEVVFVRELVRPYVSALAYLVFEQGIYPEAHAQNVLFELAADGSPTGRLALRDMSDMSVNVALRAAKDRPLPAPPAGFFPARLPFSPLNLAQNQWVTPRRARDQRGWMTMQLYGAEGGLWPVIASLKRHYPDFAETAVYGVYRRLWQSAAQAYLGVTPELSGDRHAMAIDEAIAHFVTHAPWEDRGARGPVALEADVDMLLCPGRARPRRGRVYRVVKTGWGSVFLEETGRPAFFRSARVAKGMRLVGLLRLDRLQAPRPKRRRARSRAT